MQASSDGRTGRVFPIRVDDELRALLDKAAAVKFGAGVGRASTTGQFVRWAAESAAHRILGLGQRKATRAPRTRALPCPPDLPECSLTIEGASCTVSAPLRLPARGGHAGTEKPPARYCLVEIDELHTSHDPLHGFAPDPAFPAEAQERDYRQTAEAAKVEEIAQRYDPALIFNTSPGAIDGVPVATAGRIILGGNGRTMATRLVYAGRGGVDMSTPREYLLEHAREFGVSRRDVRRFTRPMLVRTVGITNESPRTLAEWSRRLNVSLSQQLDATALAVSRARFLDDATLRELVAMEEGETLTAFLSSPRSRGFVRALQKSGVIDGRAAAVYVSDGLLNDQGRELAADLLVAVLLPDTDLI